MRIETKYNIFNKKVAVVPIYLSCISRQTAWVFSTCIAYPFNKGSHSSIEILFEDSNIREPYTTRVKKELEKMINCYIERKIKSLDLLPV